MAVELVHDLRICYHRIGTTGSNTTSRSEVRIEEFKTKPTEDEGTFYNRILINNHTITIVMITIIVVTAMVLGFLVWYVLKCNAEMERILAIAFSAGKALHYVYIGGRYGIKAVFYKDKEKEELESGKKKDHQKSRPPR